MDKISKELEKLSPDERGKIKEILVSLESKKLAGLDIKKLKGRQDIFRARKGKLRIFFRKTESNIFVLAIERRSENTYKF